MALSAILTLANAQDVPRILLSPYVPYFSDVNLIHPVIHTEANEKTLALGGPSLRPRIQSFTSSY